MVKQAQFSKRPSRRVVTNAERRNCVTALQRVADALVMDGYTTLDAQAGALGLQRSTAWTFVKAKHKLGRLSAKTCRRILTIPDLPARVRAIFVEYLSNTGRPLDNLHCRRGHTNRPDGNQLEQTDKAWLTFQTLSGSILAASICASDFHLSSP